MVKVCETKSIDFDRRDTSAHVQIQSGFMDFLFDVKLKMSAITISKKNLDTSDEDFNHSVVAYLYENHYSFVFNTNDHETNYYYVIGKDLYVTEVQWGGFCKNNLLVNKIDDSPIEKKFTTLFGDSGDYDIGDWPKQYSPPYVDNSEYQVTWEKLQNDRKQVDSFRLTFEIFENLVYYLAHSYDEYGGIRLEFTQNDDQVHVRNNYSSPQVMYGLKNETIIETIVKGCKAQ